MSETAPDPRGYTAVLRHPVAGRLLGANTLSEVGDFVGLGALLLLAFEQTESVLGPAGVFAARSLPALLVATVFSGWLDRPPRRRALTSLLLLGAVIVAIPAAYPHTATAIPAAAFLGAVRAAYRSIYTAVIAESVETSIRLRLFGLLGVVSQGSQALGIFVGGTITLVMGPRLALLADVVSFLLGAVVLKALPVGQRVARDSRPPATAGLGIIWRQPVLRLVAIMTWATFVSSALPETVAPEIASPEWVPLVMAAPMLGGAVFMLVVARSDFLERPGNQIRTAATLGCALLAGAGLLLAGSPDWGIVAVNAAIGAANGWIIGAQTTFTRLAPAARMGQVEATMVSSNILIEGVGILLLASVIVASGRPEAAYLVGGVGVLVAALFAGRRLRRTSDVYQPGRAGS